ncbi:DUF2029 domain-containing protein [Nocardioides mangrovicus]|uniref:DUF2029 domain-containing protein n=1 Tax=Nocardioides mangrovicus TaxID=2478913 RepID=A0A3L8NYR3_9ACTN|nr:glycosyltransferase family 87 protein [Nocardioides mangrovicus]RLV47911.1 DUF2029 domain-containing protein [Nocardioides mangrovicus]
MAEVDLRRSLPLHLTWLAGLAMTWLTWTDAQDNRLGRDSHAYWVALQGDHLYANAPGTVDAFNYSPAFAQLLSPFGHLPWPVFGLGFAALVVVGFVHLFRPLGWRWVFPLLLCCTPEIVSGNVFWVLALVAAYGLRYPALWAFPLLTKVTPGLGPLWFALRREWRPLLVSLVTTALVAGVSFAIAPHAWVGWLRFMSHHFRGTSAPTGSDLFPSLLVRLPVALTLLVWCALTDRRWGLPAAMALATPVSGIAMFTILAALPRLAREQERGTVEPWARSRQPAVTPS